jgi:hypothetical protein
MPLFDRHGIPTRTALAHGLPTTPKRYLAEGWRRQLALASMRAMLGTLAFAGSYERGYRDGLQNALSDGCGALNYLRRWPDEP